MGAAYLGARRLRGAAVWGGRRTACQARWVCVGYLLGKRSCGVERGFVKATQLLLLFVLLAAIARAEPVTVLRVVDGDTFKARRVDGSSITVRIAEIDAPELRQAGGTWARLVLARLLAGGAVDLERTGDGGWGRVLGRVRAGSVDVDREMVSLGAAWVFVRYPHRAELVQTEKAARSARLGVWAERAPLAPWDFRAGRR